MGASHGTPIDGMRRPIRRSLLIRPVIVLVVLIYLTHCFCRFWKITPPLYPVFNDGLNEDEWSTEQDDPCDIFESSDRVVVTVKTGVTEANLKIPSQLATSLRCVPNLIVFSDMAQAIGDREVYYDALESLPEEVTAQNPNFDLYWAQQELGDPEEVIKQLADMRSSRRPKSLAAWVLDKYENVHIVEKAWEMYPGMDWYLHIDADTYVI